MKLLSSAVPYLATFVVGAQAKHISSNHNLEFKFPAGPYPAKFELNLDSAFVEQTNSKVSLFRPTNDFGDEWTIEGPPSLKLKEAADYWKNKYDWTTRLSKINDDFNHFATVVPATGNYTEEIPLHFIHHPSKDKNAMPLLLLHGWPSSHLEWSDVIEPLVKGNVKNKQTFHVVAPDLPGFGWSPAPLKPGMGPRELSVAFNSLMQQLGYKKYGIATTDLGWFTGMWMVNEAEDHILGHFTDFWVSPANAADRARVASDEASEEEKNYVAASDAWFGGPHWLYATAQAQKPLALAQGLGDSPVGLLGWHWDVSRVTSGDFEYSFERLITDTMMLWIPGAYAGFRAYTEFFKVRTVLPPLHLDHRCNAFGVVFFLFFFLFF